MTETATVEPETGDPGTEAPETQAPPPKFSHGETPSSAAEASSVVRSYFDAINERDYQRAWSLGGKNVSRSYGEFVNGFADTVYAAVQTLGVDGDVVSVTLESTQSDGSLRVYEGTYTVRGGLIVGADLREVSAPGAEPEPEDTGAVPYYENCAEARDAGAAPLIEGEPGYAPHLDRDNDKIACESYP